VSAPSELDIRTATTADAEAVLALWRAADAVPSATDDAASVRRAAELGILLVASTGDRIVGSLIAAFDGWRGNMYRLAVEPGVRRQGVARALVAEGERRLLEQGCRRITALVVAAEDHATGFWTHVDYDADGRITRYVKTTG
jgi:ribosomal protein S18 acetylase RimI-like enzyme